MKNQLLSPNLYFAGFVELGNAVSSRAGRLLKTVFLLLHLWVYLVKILKVELNGVKIYDL